jgi:hypothetical protein
MGEGLLACIWSMLLKIESLAKYEMRWNCFIITYCMDKSWYLVVFLCLGNTVEVSLYWFFSFPFDLLPFSFYFMLVTLI